MEFGMFHEFHRRPGQSEADAFTESFELVDVAETAGLMQGGPQDRCGVPLRPAEPTQHNPMSKLSRVHRAGPEGGFQSPKRWGRQGASRRESKEETRRSIGEDFLIFPENRASPRTPAPGARRPETCR